ncbi:MAG: HupE/UreJ family protein [Pseudomonadota bacterium]|jgi:hydrogenase/urease accessory protein HupE|nr:HupE/UreJ family protein [Pseudomonadota bacterium]
MIRVFLVLLTSLLSLAAPADDFRPAYLQLTQTAPDQYEVLWKVPALDERTVLKLYPVFPPGAEEIAPRRSAFAGGSTVTHWTSRVPGGLEGRPIVIEGPGLARTDVLVRLTRLDGSEQLERLDPASAVFTAQPEAGRLEVITSYTWLGVEHILFGVDHLLFVAALVLLVRGVRPLLLTITAFTLAHSITLALATLGVLDVPGPPVEAVIALSIVFVAVEIIRRERGGSSLAMHKPWLVAFSFGLLHGLGFAGALAEVGLPRNSIPLALLFFNVGVEIGQVLFVGALLAVMALLRRLAVPVDARRAVVATSYAIGGLASYWLVERVVAFGGG